MAEAIAPQSEEELAEAIASATEPFEVCGTATKRQLGRPADARQHLDLSALKGIVIYEPEELILEARAGTGLSEIEELVSSRQQQLAFEPPDLSGLLGTKDSGTIGGIFACNLSGPRRIKAGAVRDHALGIRCVTGRGEIVKAGARVVKNVTGYDLPKLLAGSYGTLAAITTVTLKVMPKPETEETLIIHAADDNSAVAIMSKAMQSSCDASGAAFIPGEAVYIRLEGIAASVAYRRDALARFIGVPVRVMSSVPSKAKWRAIRDCVPLRGGERMVWRLSVSPSDAPAVIAGIRAKLEIAYYFDWAGGLIWLSVSESGDGHATAIRSALVSGHATLIRAPEDVRANVEVFQPQPAALAALSKRVKEAFDPTRLLNPGRMYRGV